MTAIAVHERLNDLLVNLGRSLLQYACEAGPWSSTADAGGVRTTLDRLAERQRKSVQRLAEHLDAEGFPVDFGIYPDEYTSLHYVSLKYLLSQLLQGQQALVAECEQTVRDVAHDAGARELLGEILAQEQATLAELQRLQTK